MFAFPGYRIFVGQHPSVADDIDGGGDGPGLAGLGPGYVLAV